MAKNTSDKVIAAFTHDEDKRRNIPTAEYQSMLNGTATDPIKVAYERRNRDLDPQLVWRGKEEQDWSDLMACWGGRVLTDSRSLSFEKCV